VENQFFFASDFATSRAQSMKSCAIGLIVRFFKVTRPTGIEGICNSTGRGLSPRRLPFNRNLDADMIDRKRPVAAMAMFNRTELVVTTCRGAPRPLAWNASAKDDPIGPPGRHQGSLINSAGSMLPRRSHLLPWPATTESRSSNRISVLRSSSSIGVTNGCGQKVMFN
jgi:hypothetical protein